MSRYVDIDGLGVRPIKGWIRSTAPMHYGRPVYGLPAVPAPSNGRARNASNLEICPPVFDQALNDCGANALVEMIQSLYLKEGKTPPELSRLFAYFATRVDISGGAPADDCGVTNSDLMIAAAKLGICDEALWPYQPAKFFQKPSKEAYTNAAKREAVLEFALPTIDTMKACLDDGFNFVIGFACPESYRSAETTKTGYVQYPKKGEAIIGGHDVMIYGYDDAPSSFFGYPVLLLQNSMGEKWGADGRGMIDQRYVTEGLASDAFTIRRMQ